MKPLLASFLLVLAGCASRGGPAATATTREGTTPMQLGAFSLSLTVKDLAASRAFYEKLGFSQIHGDSAQNWIILQNDTTTIGLFQGMFPRNILTFNPGWTSSAQPLAVFQDVRAIQAALMERGLSPEPAADPASTGPASFMIVDPDGNPILFDQHVPRP
jgi:catechol 2,3-dioxygenase-like lactoylglutathione lyase family enzyme